MSQSDRPLYTKEQLTQYFDYIDLPEQTRRLHLSGDPSDQIEAICTTIRHQLCHVPFENLDLHYAPVRGVSLNTSHLFNKVVERQAGRGGYCMQNNGLFATVLRSLGYNIMTTGARVATNYGSKTERQLEPEEVPYGAYTHQVNIVTIGGKKYLTDVGFGSQGPSFLVPLINGYTAIQVGTEDKVSTSLRLVRGFTANNTSRQPEQEVWAYNIKFGNASDESKHWNPVYCFGEGEFFPVDFELSSAWVSTRYGMFTNQVICQKFLMSDDGQNLIGDITLNDTVVKERRLGDNKTLEEFKSEEDRVNALEKYLGVKLNPSEREGIKGHHTAIQ